MELEASDPPRNFVSMVEILGHRAAVDVPGQRGGNMTRVLLNPIIGPDGTESLVTFVHTLYRDLIPEH